MDGGLLGQVRPAQSIFKASSQKQGEIGFHLPFNDGRVYVYSKDGGSGLTMGNLIQSEAVDTTNDINLAIPTAGKAIDTFLSLTIPTGHATFPANRYEGGFVLIEHHTEEGLMRKIKAHPLFTTGAAATVKFKFKDPLYEAVAVATHTAKLLANPYNMVKTNLIVTGMGSNTGRVCGVAPIDVAAGYYFWMQVRGLGPGISDGGATYAVGTALTAAASKVEIMTAFGDPYIGEFASYGGASADRSCMVWYKFE